MGAPNLIADTMDCGLSYSVISYLKKLSQQVKIQVSSSMRQNSVILNAVVKHSYSFSYDQLSKYKCFFQYALA